MLDHHESCPNQDVADSTITTQPGLRTCLALVDDVTDNKHTLVQQVSKTIKYVGSIIKHMFTLSDCESQPCKGLPGFSQKFGQTDDIKSKSKMKQSTVLLKPITIWEIGPVLLSKSESKPNRSDKGIPNLFDSTLLRRVSH